MDRLPALLDGNCLAVIAASATSRSKFKLEAALDAFVLHSVPPTGEDGDPLDIVVLTDDSPPVETVVPCRIIALLQAEQIEDGKRVRNDRLLGVASVSERYRHCRARKDVDAKILDRIGNFFEFYHAEQGKRFWPIGWKGRKKAAANLRHGCSAFQGKRRGRFRTGRRGIIQQ